MRSPFGLVLYESNGKNKDDFEIVFYPIMKEMRREKEKIRRLCAANEH